ncbi:helix-turn-helix domain-containing protein [Streptomyces sp. NPDC055008]
MPARKGPTLMRMMLGKELRTLRLQQRSRAEAEFAAGADAFTAEAVSLRVKMSRSRLSRIEAGDIPIPKIADLEALLDELGVTDLEDRQTLRELHLESLKTDPVTTYRNVLPSGMPRYLSLEKDSKTIQGFENAVIHGLLQCEEYTRALMGRAKTVEERTTEAVEKSVYSRLERKSILVEDREVHIILTEGTLRTLIGSPDVMRAQYAEIRSLCRMENVEVQIIPERSSAYRAPFPFTRLTFEGLPPMIQMDGWRSITIYREEADTGSFRRQFEAMVREAPGSAETPSFLKQLEQELWT